MDNPNIIFSLYSVISLGTLTSREILITSYMALVIDLDHLPVINKDATNTKE
jgi:hypothetical protein